MALGPAGTGLRCGLGSPAEALLALRVLAHQPLLAHLLLHSARLGRLLQLEGALQSVTVGSLFRASPRPPPPPHSFYEP